MKTHYTLSLISLFFSLQAFSQNIWTQKANIGGQTRECATAFSVNGKGYFCCGRSGTSTYLTDLWEYNDVLDTWTQRMSYPGIGSFDPTSFVIGSLAYVGLGASPTAQTSFYEYNPGTNQWTPIATFPGVARYGAGAFSIGTKGYVVGGTAGGPPYLSDMWVYDQPTDTWSTGTAFAGGSRNHLACFTYNGKGYAGTGSPTTSSGANDMWEFDPGINAWTAKASFVGTARRAVMAFSIYQLLFVCAGLDGSGNVMQDLWEYNAANNTWTNRTSFPGTSRWEGRGFSLNGYGYAGGGADATLATSYNDFWQYAPINVGVEESDNTISLFVYPNPFTNEINASGLTGTNEIKVFSSSGESVYSTVISTSTFTFRPSTLPSGVYFIKISGAEGTITKRIVKQ